MRAGDGESGLGPGLGQAWLASGSCGTVQQGPQPGEKPPRSGGLQRRSGAGLPVVRLSRVRRNRAASALPKAFLPELGVQVGLPSTDLVGNYGG